MGPTDEPLSSAPADSAGTTPAPQTTEAVDASVPNEPAIAASDPEPIATEPVTAVPPTDPAIASTVSIPADESDDGGEWELLTGKLRDWMASNELGELWDKTKTPAKLIGALLLLVVVVQIYSGILNTIAKIPLAPGLLELAGVIWLGRFALQKLIRNDDRREVADNLRQLWSKVVGR